MKNYRELTKKDIKTLKMENRTSYIACLILFLFVGVVNLLIYLISGGISHLTIKIDAVIAIVAFGVVYFVNKPRNKDIAERIKIYELRKVVEIRKEIDYEAGSAALYLPIAAKISWRFWGKPMKPYDKYTLFLASNNVEIHTIDEELHRTIQVSDFVEVYYSKNGNSFLGIALHKEEEN